jgi:hypothetical protein
MNAPNRYGKQEKMQATSEQKITRSWKPSMLAVNRALLKPNAPSGLPAQDIQLPYVYQILSAKKI